MIVAFSNHKGGAAKTTSVINIGGALRQLKKKVLLVDIDPQSNLTKGLGIRQFCPQNIYGALSGRYSLPIITTEEGIDIVPSTLDLAGAERELYQVKDYNNLLKRLLDPFKNKYDYIIIDCPPNLGILTANALAASQYVIIPVDAGYFALDGLTKLIEVINIVKKNSNPKLEIGAVISTKFDSRKSLDNEISNSLDNEFKEKVLHTKIRNNVSLGEAQAVGTSIFSYKKNSLGAKDYMSVTKELMKILK